MRKFVKVLALVLAALTLTVSLASCDFIDTLLKRGGEIDYKAEIEKLAFDSAEFVYDGEAKSIFVTGTLPEGVTVTYDGNGKVEVGVYTVTAKFHLDGNYIEGSDKSATLTVTANDNGGADGTDTNLSTLAESLKSVMFEDAELVYSGEAQSLSVSGDLPEGVTVRYKNNGKKNSGIYTVIAEFYYGDTHIKGADKSATLTIVRASYDMSGITLASKTVTYDGKNHSLKYEGTLPAGVSASYSANSFKNAGVYDVTLRFTVADVYNYEPIAPIEATLTIEKASFDMSGITFPDGIIEYDNAAHSLEISGTLPEGLSVSYVGEYVYPGEYEIEARFSADDAQNYVLPESMKATLTIVLGDNYVMDLSHITFNDAEVTYDGTAHTHKVSGNIPYNVTVEYLCEGNLTDVGTYEITACFYFLGEELSNNRLTSTLTVKKADIDMSNIEFVGKMVIFDGKAHTVSVTGELPPGVSVTYTGGNVSAPGTYEVVASFTVENGENYNAPADMTATLVIASDAVATEGVIIEGGEVVGYDGDSAFVVIPATYNGVPVTSVKSGAFMNKDVEAVYIPSSVTNIGNNAFRGCEKLHTLYVSEGVKVIGQYAFAGIKAEKIVLPNSLEYIGVGALSGAEVKSLTIPFIGDARVSSSNYLSTIFGAADYAGGKRVVPSTLKEIILSDACTEIPEYAFFGLDTVENIVISSSVKKIGNSAFYGCTGIKKIYIPEAVEEMLANTAPHNSAFYGCSKDIVLYVGAESGAAYGFYWRMISNTENAEVVYGVTAEEYSKIQ